MGIFNKHIEDSPITAFQIASLKTDGGRFGEYGGWAFLKPSIDLDKITPKDIDEVLSNILSYIYYFVRLGICNTNLNKNQVSNIKNSFKCLFDSNINFFSLIFFF